MASPDERKFEVSFNVNRVFCVHLLDCGAPRSPDMQHIQPNFEERVLIVLTSSTGAERAHGPVL